MFKPARMTRVLIGGHQSRMEDVIELLHKEQVVHLEDYRDESGITTIGTPLEAGDATSDLLVRVRGLLKAIDAEGMEGKQMPGERVADLVAEAEADLAPLVQEAAQLRGDLAAQENELAHLAPFASVDTDLGLLPNLNSIVGYFGNVKSDPRADFDAAGFPFEATVDGTAIALGVGRDFTAEADAILAKHGYTAAAIPEDAQGTPAQRITHIREAAGRNQERLDRANQRLAQQREQWGPRLCAIEQHLTAEVDKTQAPLKFGVTDTTFHIEGWVPEKRLNRVHNALSAKFGDMVYFEELGDAPTTHGDHDDHHVSPADEAPVQLDNKGPARYFEFMLGLLGRPRYNEIDPTKLMFLFFPLFFGLMVGDVLVGLAIVGMGVFLKKNYIFGIGGPSVGKALIMGGWVAVVVGALIFGEALGIHFAVSDEAIAEGEHSWEAVIWGTHIDESGHRVLNAEFSHEGFLHKVEGAHHGAAEGGHGDAVGHTDEHGNETGNATGNETMSHGNESMAHGGEPSFGVLAAETEEAHGGGGLGGILTPHGTTHLNAGPVQLGHYSKIHDIQALLAWSILIAVVHLNLAFLIGVRNIAVGHGWTLAIQEKVSWITAQIGIAIAVYGGVFHGPTWALPVGIGVFVLSIALLWKGVEKALGAPGFVAILEFLGFFGNLLSYTRLAAIGASKAGMALAFAAIGFDVIGGGNIQSIAGWIFYLFGMVVITLLAMLSGGLQSLRLQFVEFFGKFYEGGGRAYTPFGRR